MLGWGERRLAN